MATAAALAGAAAATAYLDAKFQISKDLRIIIKFRRAERAYANAVQRHRNSCFYLIEQAVQARGDELLLWSRTGNYTFRETLDRTYQYAAYFLTQGIRPGGFVGLYLLNSPEFIFAVLALWSIGASPALINYNLSSQALFHSLKISGTKVLLVDTDKGCQERIENERDRLENELGIKIVTFSDDLKADIASLPASRPDNSYRDGVGATDCGLLIYTSGTTGLPKAFPYGHDRLYVAGITTLKTYHCIPGKDRWYDCMPFYHGTGLIAALSCAMSGISVAIARKFSLSQFWPDVRESESTGFVYVGETARFLLSAPPSPLDKEHKLRMMFGNGLRPDVWVKFQERFGVPEVGEFFTSTEGMFATSVYARNSYYGPSVGHHGALMRLIYHKIYVPVRTDPDTGDMYRDSRGYAQRCSYSEGGEILVKMDDPSLWPGYWNAKEASNKKFVRDVFTKGDLYYRPGDALLRTDDGHWKFLDRLGDTFRWRSENVSTAEVSEVIGLFPGIFEANVYGVELPHHEGRAGCAAVGIAPGEQQSFDWKALADYARSKLPRYAVPVFIRVMSGEAGAMASGNNKQVKVPFRQEGVDPKLRGSKVAGGATDQMFWLPKGAGAYVPFTDQDWNNLVAGKANL